jgi:hypothetical protein
MTITVPTLEEAYQRLTIDPLYALMIMPDGQHIEFVNMASPRSIDLVPGSFNPLHDAHKELYVACKEPESIKAFEISIRRFDKELLSLEELKARIKQFAWYAPVLITNASLFIEKCGLLSNCSKRPRFHIGVDTAERIIKAHGVSGTQGIFGEFVVYDRLVEGKIHSINDFPVKPNNFRHGAFVSGLVHGISSTELRQNGKTLAHP